MDTKKDVELLENKLQEIPKLKKLHYLNPEILLWRDSIEDILETAFGLDSIEYKRFYETRAPISSQQQYTIQLMQRAVAVTSIINRQTLIEKRTGEALKGKVKTEDPINIFDAMQFHQNVIKASRALFEDEHYAQAIFEAFKAVENFVQDKADLKTYGTNLMETVFNEENPIIKVPEAGHYYKDVQRGFKHLFIGAAQAIRNPKAHQEIIQNDPYITLEYLGFASFLLKRISYWEAGTT